MPNSRREYVKDTLFQAKILMVNPISRTPLTTPFFIAHTPWYIPYIRECPLCHPCSFIVQLGKKEEKVSSIIGCGIHPRMNQQLCNSSQDLKKQIEQRIIWRVFLSVTHHVECDPKRGQIQYSVVHNYINLQFVCILASHADILLARHTIFPLVPWVGKIT